MVKTVPCIDDSENQTCLVEVSRRLVYVLSVCLW